MQRRPAVILLLVGVVVVGCTAGAQVSVTPAPQVTTNSPSAQSSLIDDGPTTSWDHPFMSEGVTVDSRALVATPQAFGLSFTPTIPVFSTGKVRWVDVSRGGTVAFTFDFSGDPRFPVDARVQVEQSTATMTEGEFLGIKWSGTYSLTPVGATTILLQQYNGVGDTKFIRGGLLYEFLGPALAPSTALELATELVKQLG